MLGGVPPEHFDTMFYLVIDHLEKQAALDPLRRRGGCVLITLDGNENFTSTSIGGDGCSTRRLKNSEVQNFHAMLAASIVAPGTSSLPPLPRSSFAAGMGPQSRIAMNLPTLRLDLPGASFQKPRTF